MPIPESAKRLRIIFMGTPEFAVASLDAMVDAGFNIVAVVTAPDRPAGRGMKLTESAVKKYALSKGMVILQPEKLRDPAFLAQLGGLHADIQVVVAFRMLPEVVFTMPPMGAVNVHASLLPRYRGAAPINWAIINGENETGVTTFRLAKDIDTGNVLLQETVPIGWEENAGELHDKLKIAGASLLIKTLTGLADNNLEEKPQVLPDRHDVTLPLPPVPHAPKLFTDTCRIDWNKNVDELFNLVRGLSPFPGAFTLLDGKIFKILRATKEYAAPVTGAGVIRSDKKTYLKFTCKNGYLSATEIQAEGKKRMNIEEFLRGYRFQQDPGE